MQLDLVFRRINEWYVYIDQAVSGIGYFSGHPQPPTRSGQVVLCSWRTRVALCALGHKIGLSIVAEQRKRPLDAITGTIVNNDTVKSRRKTLGKPSLKICRPRKRDPWRLLNPVGMKSCLECKAAKARRSIVSGRKTHPNLTATHAHRTAPFCLFALWPEPFGTRQENYVLSRKCLTS